LKVSLSKLLLQLEENIILILYHAEESPTEQKMRNLTFKIGEFSDKSLPANADLKSRELRLCLVNWGINANSTFFCSAGISSSFTLFS